MKAWHLKAKKKMKPIRKWRKRKKCTMAESLQCVCIQLSAAGYVSCNAIEMAEASENLMKWGKKWRK
jgi:hypothetical protein